MSLPRSSLSGVPHNPEGEVPNLHPALQSPMGSDPAYSTPTILTHIFGSVSVWLAV